MPKTVDLSVLRDFSEQSVEALNAMTTSDVIVALGAPTEHVVCATAQGWSPGDGRPDLASEDPAVMQAIGQCAAFKTRLRFSAPLPLTLAAHPGTCEWCGYPLVELVKACAWATWQSRLITAHVLEWKNKENRQYLRPGSLTGYQNPEYRRFWDLPPKERDRRVAAASGRDQMTALIEGEK